METKDLINLIINSVTTVCTVILTIIGIYTFKQLVTKKNYYGEEAEKEFKKLTLDDKDVKESYKLPDKSKRMLPQLKIEKHFFDKSVTYCYEDKTVKVWKIKETIFSK